MVLSAAAELSDINNLPFLAHPSLMRAEPTETRREREREQINTDRPAWRKGEKDPDKEEINIGSGDEGCAHIC